MKQATPRAEALGRRSEEGSAPEPVLSFLPCSRYFLIISAALQMCVGLLLPLHPPSANVGCWEDLEGASCAFYFVKAIERRTKRKAERPVHTHRTEAVGRINGKFVRELGNERNLI